MSKYHPLDVRHPANKHRQRNTYLLDPVSETAYDLQPIRTVEQPESRRAPSNARRATEDAPPTDPQQPPASSPWGGATSGSSTTSQASAPAPEPSPTPTPVTLSSMQKRRKSRLPMLISFGIIAFFLLRETSFGHDLWFYLTSALYDMGLL